MKLWLGILVLAGLLAGGLVEIVVGGDGKAAPGTRERLPGQPAVSVISPRNGSVQPARAVVVKVDVSDFRLAPRQFGEAPQLGEGHIRFALNRVPNCVEKSKLARAINSPAGSGRLIGRSYDYPKYSGPNGVLAERSGSAGLYSPASRPEIYYQKLPPGFYRLIITLAENNGASTPYHAVTNFEIVPDPRRPEPPQKDCRGKVSSAQAAEAIR